MYSKKGILSSHLFSCPPSFLTFFALMFSVNTSMVRVSGSWSLRGIPYVVLCWAARGENKQGIERCATSHARFTSYSHRHLKKHSPVTLPILKLILLISLDLCAFFRIHCENPSHAQELFEPLIPAQQRSCYTQWIFFFFFSLQKVLFRSVIAAFIPLP